MACVPYLAQAIDIMTGSSNFWTPLLQQDFHQSVAELREVTQTPAAARYYRDCPMPKSNDHILSFQDELQMADDIAFLCHRDEGVGYVSAVTLQEHSNRLVILLASNSTPSQTTTQVLGDIAEIISQYTRRSRHINPAKAISSTY